MSREAKGRSRWLAAVALVMIPTAGWAGTVGLPVPGHDADEAPAAPDGAVAFEANLGQYPPGFKFAARGAGGATTFLGAFGAVSLLGDAAVSMTLHDVARPLQPMGEAPLPGKVNHLRGSDPDQWVRGAATYSKVRYPGVHPGIDLVFYGAPAGGIEYDFVVAPGADPRAIVLAFEGQDAVRIDASGDLVLDVAGRELRHRAPVAFQERVGDRHPVEARFVLTPEGRVTFALGAYDPGLPLVIDPVLSWATYLGSPGEDGAYGVATDAAGSVYVVGYTRSAAFPLLDPLDGTVSGSDVTLTKYDVEGRMLFSTYLGGSRNDYGQAIAVGPDGNVYLAGYMQSEDFPFKNPIERYVESNMDVFVTVVNPEGTDILFSTSVGGWESDYGRAIAVGEDGVVYVAGSTNNPSTGDFDVLVAAVDPKEPKLVYLETFGGAKREEAYGVAVGPEGRARVVGYTDSPDFPALDPLQGPGGGRDAFVAVLSAGGELEFSTPLGGTSADEARDVMVDAGGSTYVVGTTWSPAGFPLVDPLWSTGSGFVLRLDPDFEIAFSTRTAGDGDTGRSVERGPEGHVVVAGETSAKDLPLVRAVQGPNSGRMAYVLQLEPGGGEVRSLTYAGGTEPRTVTGLAVDGEGSVTVVGYVNTVDSPMPTWVPWAQAYTGHVEGFVIRVSECVTEEPFQVFTEGLKGRSGWWRHLGYLTIRARCPVDGFVSVDGAPETRSMAIRNLQDGERSVTLRAVRLDGSAEPPRELTFRVDGTRPDLLIVRDCKVPGKGSWCHTDLRVEVAASDALSGLARLECSLRSIEKRVPCASHDVTGDGRHWHYYIADDVAGNTALRSGYHEIDGTPPEGTLLVSCTDWGKAGWCRGTARVNFDALDRTSGLETSRCSVADLVVATCVKAFVETPHEGVHEALLTAEDYAGHAIALRDLVKIDHTPPTVRLAEPAEGDAYVHEHRDPLDTPLPYTVVAGSKVLRSEASDALSGVERVEFFVDGVLVGTDYEAPYEHAWDTSRESLGEHRLLVRAFDFAEHSAEEERVVHVVPLPPPPGVPAVPG